MSPIKERNTLIFLINWVWKKPWKNRTPHHIRRVKISYVLFNIVHCCNLSKTISPLKMPILKFAANKHHCDIRYRDDLSNLCILGNDKFCPGVNYMPRPQIWRAVSTLHVPVFHPIYWFHTPHHGFSLYLEDLHFEQIWKRKVFDEQKKRETDQVQKKMMNQEV